MNDTATVRALAHHGPHGHYRCVSIRGILVCRRCTAVAVGYLCGCMVGFFGPAPPTWVLRWVWVGTVTTGAELLIERRGWLRYGPARVVALTVLATLPAGWFVGSSF